MKLEYCNFFCSFAHRRCNGNTEILLFIEKLLTSVFSWNFIELREPPYWAEYSKTRLIIHTVCLSKYFDLAIAGVIGLNVITMAMEFYMMPEVRFLEHGLIPQKKITKIQPQSVPKNSLFLNYFLSVSVVAICAQDLQLLLHVRVYPGGYREDYRIRHGALLQGQVNPSNHSIMMCTNHL